MQRGDAARPPLPRGRQPAQLGAVGVGHATHLLYSVGTSWKAVLTFCRMAKPHGITSRRGVMRKCALRGFSPFTLAGVPRRQSSGPPNANASYAGGSLALTSPLALVGDHCIPGYELSARR